MGEPPSVKYSTASVNVVVPAFAVDRTRYTREPAAGAVNDTGWVTRAPCGIERVAPPDAITAPAGLSSRYCSVPLAVEPDASRVVTDVGGVAPKSTSA